LALPSVEEIHFPRDVDIGPDGILHVVDRTATVHRLFPDGRLIASLPMPERERGNPQGLSVAPDGRILVADTHYNRVVILSPQGECLARFGSFGRNEGEFIYPTAVVMTPEGELAVAEYGGNDRIQVFGPDFRVRRTIGKLGKGPGEFSRPSGMCLGADGLLYVADACNHRVQVFRLQGEWVRSFGNFGTGPGNLHYPFDVAWTEAGTLAVVEYGNNRVQEFTPAGESLRCLGGPGSGKDQFHNPWGIAAGKPGIVVADSWNHRLQVWK
jgi:DNA-binding beta-propeller fold protein YncE